MEKYYVYFLKSLSDNGYYIGCTSMHPLKRLELHNKGLVKSTKPRIPFRLVYFEEFDNKKAAFKREWFLKKPVGYLEKVKIINNLGV